MSDKSILTIDTMNHHFTCCGNDLGELMIQKDDKWFISGKLAFHLYDTHGIPVEITEYVVNEKIKGVK